MKKYIRPTCEVVKVEKAFWLMSTSPSIMEIHDVKSNSVQLSKRNIYIEDDVWMVSKSHSLWDEE